MEEQLKVVKSEMAPSIIPTVGVATSRGTLPEVAPSIKTQNITAMDDNFVRREMQDLQIPHYLITTATQMAVAINLRRMFTHTDVRRS